MRRQLNGSSCQLHKAVYTLRNVALHSGSAGLPALPYLVSSETFFPVLMTTTIQQRSGANGWQSFCEWVTSTNNRLYVGWFGVLMIPTLLAATCFIVAFIAAPPSTSTASVSPLLAPDLRQQHHLWCCCALLERHRPSLLSHLGSCSSMSGCTTAVLTSWLSSTSLIGIFCYMGREWNSPTASACALDLRCLQRTCGCCLPCSWCTPSVRVPSLTACPWASLAPSTSCWCSRLSTTS